MILLAFYFFRSTGQPEEITWKQFRSTMLEEGDVAKLDGGKPFSGRSIH
ncbi:MAG: hypothetical protein HC880_04670 [Bacteroidia bacterium]|nr:hypothetical protein [Bacteroidia bacterium]